ncbi:hypothetical protein EI94DRAFT_134062 [Lactarius quietus]|nr:hypothetical protein EI94DRAFT_134062 [Lactarius quietus]
MGACCSKPDGTIPVATREVPEPRAGVHDLRTPGGPSSQQTGTKQGHEIQQVVRFRDQPRTKSSARPRTDAVPRSRAKSAPVNVKQMNDTDPSPSPRSRAKSSNAPSQRVRAESSFGPASPHIPMSAEHSRASPRRTTLSYPTRRPLLSTVRQVLHEHLKFRILVVGKRRSRKSSLIKTVFKVDVKAAPERANINFEFRPDDNRYLIVHEFSGLYSQAVDSQDLQTIRDFILLRTDPKCSPTERLHAIWICIPASDIVDGRLGDGVEDILSLRNVPVVVVLTKFDVLVTQILLFFFFLFESIYIPEQYLNTKPVTRHNVGI